MRLARQAAGDVEETSCKRRQARACRPGKVLSSAARDLARGGPVPSQCALLLQSRRQTSVCQPSMNRARCGPPGCRAREWGTEHASWAGRRQAHWRAGRHSPPQAPPPDAPELEHRGPRRPRLAGRARRRYRAPCTRAARQPQPCCCAEAPVRSCAVQSNALTHSRGVIALELTECALLCRILLYIQAPARRTWQACRDMYRLVLPVGANCATYGGQTAQSGCRVRAQAPRTRKLEGSLPGITGRTPHALGSSCKTPCATHCRPQALTHCPRLDVLGAWMRCAACRSEICLADSRLPQVWSWMRRDSLNEGTPSREATRQWSKPSHTKP